MGREAKRGDKVTYPLKWYVAIGLVILAGVSSYLWR